MNLRRPWRALADLLGRVIDGHPFVSMLVVVVLVAVPGYLRLEFAIDAQRDANARLEEVVDEADAAREREDLNDCRALNAGNEAVRAALGRLIDTVAELGLDPEDVAVLRERGIPPAEDTDRDCNADTLLTGADYPARSPDARPGSG